MKYIKPIGSLLLLAALAGLIWYFFFPPPEKVIRKQLTKLSEALSANPQGNIARAANVNTIVYTFHPDVTINLEGFGREVQSVEGRKDLQQITLAARQNLQRLTVSLDNLKIVMGPTDTNATVFGTAVVRINDAPEPLVHDLKIGMEKLDRKWLIRSATPARAFIVK